MAAGELVEAVPGYWSYKELTVDQVKWYYLRTPLSLKGTCALRADRSAVCVSSAMFLMRIRGTSLRLLGAFKVAQLLLAVGKQSGPLRKCLQRVCLRALQGSTSRTSFTARTYSASVGRTVRSWKQPSSEPWIT